MWVRGLLSVGLAFVVITGCGSDPETGPGDSGVDAAVERDGSVAAADAELPPADAALPPADAASADGDAGPNAADLQAWIDDYKATHAGNGGKDWDIIGCCGGASRSESELAGDPDTVRLRSVCGPGRMPVIPQLAWEYGGADHPWINPEASALVYCVYLPAPPGAEHWQYDGGSDHVDADLYVLYQDENPCRDQPGRFQVMACLGEATNIEILVDTASFHDGADVGLSLSEATTDLYLLPADGSRVLMYQGL